MEDTPPRSMDATETDAPSVTGLPRSGTHTPRPESPAERDAAPRQPSLLHRQPALHRPRASSNLSDTSVRAQQRRRELGLGSPVSVPTSPTSVSYASEPVHRQSSLRSHRSSGPPTPPSCSADAAGHGSDESVYSDDDASAVPSLHRTLSSQSRVSGHSQGSATRSPSLASTRSVLGGRGLVRRADAPRLPPRPPSLSGSSSPLRRASAAASPSSPPKSPRAARGSLPASPALRAAPAPSDSQAPALGPSASSESLSSAYSEDAGASAPAVPEPAPASQLVSPPSTSTPRMPSQGTVPGSRATSGGLSMRSPASDTMQDLFDTFASALADLGLDDAPIDGLHEVDVQYRPMEYPGGSHGLPSSASTLESLLPPRERSEPRAGPAVPAASPTPSAPPAAQGPTPSAPAAQGPTPSAPAAQDTMPGAPPDHIEVYGLTVWWPGSFDVASNVNYDSVTNRALLYANAANDLLARPTHLDTWIERAQKQRPNVPDVLTTMVMKEQVRALEAQMTSGSDAVAAPADLPLPTNIPYPLLAKAQSAAHSDPGLLLATPSTGTRSLRRPHASTLIQSLNQLGRRKTPAPAMTARATPVALTPVAPTPATATPAATTPGAAPPAPPRMTPWAPEAPMGLGILSRTPSAMSVGATGAVPDAQMQAALARMRDALPDIDEATARRYLMRHKGDDMRAITDYVQEHAHDEAPYRRGLFRTPRAR
ncbi:hypothetical protein MCAP1_001641 [Malassezia caprae]|uniref:Uncharacterized protein n=1 Tax=Malassezia caprae TaxID=1381934 RepID=A0AAF0E9X9_9BASI|nr:hypothetical protein MCAP1_001641 [Malassezia caprae]